MEYSKHMASLQPSGTNAPANHLCSDCGLCCNGSLFIWVKLRHAELAPVTQLGMTIFDDHPTQRGFLLPCPQWQSKCTIYDNPNYPHACRAFNCTLLKKLMNNDVTLPAALGTIAVIKEQIDWLKVRLPPSSSTNFREQLVALLEGTAPAPGLAGLGDEFAQRANALLADYEEILGITDLLEKPIID